MLLLQNSGVEHSWISLTRDVIPHNSAHARVSIRGESQTFER